MKKWFLILSMISSFIILSSCNTEKKNADLKKDIVRSKTPDSWMYYYGDFYCVINDTVLIFDRSNGRIVYEDNYRKLTYNFHLFPWSYQGQDNTNMIKLIDYFKEPKQYAELTYAELKITDEDFILFDESNKPNNMSLFSINRSYNDIPDKRYYESENRWHLNNSDAITKWQSNPISNMDTMICYLDLNKKVCKLTSGYSGSFNEGPLLSYEFKRPLYITVHEQDTIRKLGYPKIDRRKVKLILMLDTRRYKHFDYICITYMGLKQLAKDLNKTIKPTKYPLFFFLEDKL